MSENTEPSKAQRSFQADYMISVHLPNTAFSAIKLPLSLLVTQERTWKGWNLIKRSERQIFPMWPHIYWVGSGFQQSWACTALIKVPINSGHSWLTWGCQGGQDLITGHAWALCSSSEISGWSWEVNWVVRTENQPQEPAALKPEKNLFFLTSHFYDLLFVFQIFLTFQPPGIWQPPV